MSNFTCAEPNNSNSVVLGLPAGGMIHRGPWLELLGFCRVFAYLLASSTELIGCDLKVRPSHLPWWRLKSLTLIIRHACCPSSRGFPPITSGVFCDFRPGVSSLRFPLTALYLFTWYQHNMLCRRESPRREFTPVLAPGREFHSGTKSRNGIM